MNKNLQCLTAGVQELNRLLLEVSWREVDFDNQDCNLQEFLNKEQNDLIASILENIPEWKRLLNCRQHRTHDYCLDVHTLSVLKRVREAEGFDELIDYDKLIVLYSALLHDIDKKEGIVDAEHPMRGAKTSSSILFKLGFDEEFINDIYLLIYYHPVIGLMASDRICLTDEELVKIFKNHKILELQTMLSIADIKSVQRNGNFFKEHMDEKIKSITDRVRRLL